MWEAIESWGRAASATASHASRTPAHEYLRDHSICLEMCPTSNWITRSVASLESHPLPLVLRAGIPVCINTDDPGVFDVVDAR